jgi:hypothetical protein
VMAGAASDDIRLQDDFRLERVYRLTSGEN